MIHHLGPSKSFYWSAESTCDKLKWNIHFCSRSLSTTSASNKNLLWYLVTLGPTNWPICLLHYCSLSMRLQRSKWAAFCIYRVQWCTLSFSKKQGGHHWASNMVLDLPKNKRPPGLVLNATSRIDLVEDHFHTQNRLVLTDRASGKHCLIFYGAYHFSEWYQQTIWDKIIQRISLLLTAYL